MNSDSSGNSGDGARCPALNYAPRRTVRRLPPKKTISQCPSETAMEESKPVLIDDTVVETINQNSANNLPFDDQETVYYILIERGNKELGKYKFCKNGTTGNLLLDLAVDTKNNVKKISKQENQSDDSNYISNEDSNDSASLHCVLPSETAQKLLQATQGNISPQVHVTRIEGEVIPTKSTNGSNGLSSVPAIKLFVDCCCCTSKPCDKPSTPESTGKDNESTDGSSNERYETPPPPVLSKVLVDQGTQTDTPLHLLCPTDKFNSVDHHEPLTILFQDGIESSVQVSTPADNPVCEVENINLSKEEVIENCISLQQSGVDLNTIANIGPNLHCVCFTSLHGTHYLLINPESPDNAYQFYDPANEAIKENDVPVASQSPQDIRLLTYFNVKPAPLPHDMNALKTELNSQNFFSEPMAWLIRQDLIQKPACSCESLMNPTCSSKKIKDWEWICSKCESTKEFVWTSFFEEFRAFALTDILTVIYHWSFQLGPEEFQKHCNLTLDEAVFILHGIHKQCTKKLSDACGRLGGNRVDVGVTIVSYRNFSILVSMETITHFSRMQVFNSNDESKHEDMLATLQKWLIQNTIAFTNCVKLAKVLKNNVRVYSIADDIFSKNSRNYDTYVENLQVYIAEQLSDMFGHVENLTLEFVQDFLNELQWRQRFGHHLMMAFENALTMICNGKLTPYPVPFRKLKYGKESLTGKERAVLKEFFPSLDERPYMNKQEEESSNSIPEGATTELNSDLMKEGDDVQPMDQGGLMTEGACYPEQITMPLVLDANSVIKHVGCNPSTSQVGYENIIAYNPYIHVGCTNNEVEPTGTNTDSLDGAMPVLRPECRVTEAARDFSVALNSSNQLAVSGQTEITPHILTNQGQLSVINMGNGEISAENDDTVEYQTDETSSEFQSTTDNPDGYQQDPVKPLNNALNVLVSELQDSNETAEFDNSTSENEELGVCYDIEPRPPDIGYPPPHTPDSQQEVPGSSDSLVDSGYGPLVIDEDRNEDEIPEVPSLVPPPCETELVDNPCEELMQTEKINLDEDPVCNVQESTFSDDDNGELREPRELSEDYYTFIDTSIANSMSSDPGGETVSDSVPIMPGVIRENDQVLKPLAIVHSCGSNINNINNDDMNIPVLDPQTNSDFSSSPENEEFVSVQQPQMIGEAELDNAGTGIESNSSSSDQVENVPVLIVDYGNDNTNTVYEILEEVLLVISSDEIRAPSQLGSDMSYSDKSKPVSEDYVTICTYVNGKVKEDGDGDGEDNDKNSKSDDAFKDLGEITARPDERILNVNSEDYFEEPEDMYADCNVDSEPSPTSPLVEQQPVVTDSVRNENSLEDQANLNDSPVNEDVIDVQAEIQATSDDVTETASQLDNDIIPEDTVDNLETPVDNLETPVDNLETPVDNLETPVDNLETPVDNLETPVDNLETPVDNLETPAAVEVATPECIPPEPEVCDSVQSNIIEDNVQEASKSNVSDKDDSEKQVPEALVKQVIPTMKQNHGSHGDKKIVRQSLYMLASLKTWPYDISKGTLLPCEDTQEEVMLLRVFLMNEKYFSEPVRWLTDRLNLKRTHQCRYSDGTLVRRNDDFVTGRKTRECKITSAIYLPAFLQYVSCDMERVMHLIYYWCVQSSLSDMQYSYEVVWWVYSKLREICSSALSRTQRNPLGENGTEVHATLIHYKPFSYLCAMDMESKAIRMKAYRTGEIVSVQQLNDELRSWVADQANMVAYFPEFSDNESDCITIQCFVQKATNLIMGLFGHFCMDESRIDTQLIQGVLDEFMWRRMFGDTAKDALKHILQCIVDQDEYVRTDPNFLPVILSASFIVELMPHGQVSPWIKGCSFDACFFKDSLLVSYSREQRRMRLTSAKSSKSMFESISSNPFHTVSKRQLADETPAPRSKKRLKLTEEVIELPGQSEESLRHSYDHIGINRKRNRSGNSNSSSTHKRRSMGEMFSTCFAEHHPTCLMLNCHILRKIHVVVPRAKPKKRKGLQKADDSPNDESSSVFDSDCPFFETPYPSSVDIICPICLRVFPIDFGPENTDVDAFYRHMFRHGLAQCGSEDSETNCFRIGFLCEDLWDDVTCAEHRVIRNNVCRCFESQRPGNKHLNRYYQSNYGHSSSNDDDSHPNLPVFKSYVEGVKGKCEKCDFYSRDGMELANHAVTCTGKCLVVLKEKPVVHRKQIRRSLIQSSFSTYKPRHYSIIATSSDGSLKCLL